MSDQREDPDASLLTAVAAGDERAFAVLYRRYLPVVLRWCLRETRNREPQLTSRRRCSRRH